MMKRFAWTSMVLVGLPVAAIACNSSNSGLADARRSVDASVDASAARIDAAVIDANFSGGDGNGPADAQQVFPIDADVTPDAVAFGMVALSIPTFQEDDSSWPLLFQDADGSTVKDTTFGSLGSVAANLHEGGSITIVPTVGGTAFALTIANVHPGDNYILNDAPVFGGPGPQMSFHVPASDTAVSYGYRCHADLAQAVLTKPNRSRAT